MEQARDVFTAAAKRVRTESSTDNEGGVHVQPAKKKKILEQEDFSGDSFLNYLGLSRKGFKVCKIGSPKAAFHP